MKRSNFKDLKTKHYVKAGVFSLLLAPPFLLHARTPDDLIKSNSQAKTTSPISLRMGMEKKVKNFHLKHVPHEMIVKFNDSVTMEEIESILKAQGAAISHRYSSNGAFLIRVKKSAFSSAINMLASEPVVEYIEANTIISLSDLNQTTKLLPNDFKFGDLWGLHNTGQGNGVVDADIDAPEAWELTTGSKDIITAVIDTGIDYKHGDLTENYWKNPGESGVDAEGKQKENNGIDDDGNGFIDDYRGWDFVSNDNDPMDDHGHGSHCAGTIAAIGNNERGVTGINWNASVVGIKFLDASGSGSLDHAVLSIEYATKLGVHLTSNSWGGGGYSETMFAAINQAREKGILFVAAAGNDGQNNDLNPSYPSSYALDNIISVAALDASDHMAKFSNYGSKSVHLGAPGVEILSTVPGQKYALMSGTSMAAPHVSGVVALVKSFFPKETYNKIRNRLLFSSSVIPATLNHTLSGGRLNAFSALKQDDIPPAKVMEVTIAKMELNSIDIAFQSVGDDGIEGNARAYEIIYSAEGEPNAEEKSQMASRVLKLDRPVEKGETVHAKIVDLPFESRGSIRVRAFDSVGNQGEFSDPIPFELPKVYTFYHNNAQSLTQTQPDDPWGLENTSAPDSDGSSFSDSPQKEYRSNIKSSLIINEISIPSTETSFVKIIARASLEENFDFVHTDVSFDKGATWKRIGSITGQHQWSDFIYKMPTIPPQTTKMLLRLRIETDYSVVDDGIQVDSIGLFSKMPEKK